ILKLLPTERASRFAIYSVAVLQQIPRPDRGRVVWLRSWKQSGATPLSVVPGQRLVDELLALGEIVMTVHMATDNERGPRVKLFVLMVAAGELRTDGVPAELQQPNSFLGRKIRRLHIATHVKSDLRMVQIDDIGGQLDHPASAQFTDDVEHHRI